MSADAGAPKAPWRGRLRRSFGPGCCALALSMTGCGKEAAPPPARGAVEVSVVTVKARATPVTFEFVGQTQSSREVEIRARVDGFLEKRLYTEGSIVKSGQALFQMDRKPFEAALQSAQGALAQRKAALDVAVANLGRVRPLAAEDAVSLKDLDDAVGAEQRARAAVLESEAQVVTAKLNLGYTTIASPLAGASSFAKVQEGTYLNAQNSLLTTISQVDPIWVNFSISENEQLRWSDEVAKGTLSRPADNGYDVELVLADGSVFPRRGRISFANPSYSKETGTFLVRSEIANPARKLMPGQFVRVLVKGATRPASILLPQRAVLQGQRSHFVWVVGKDGKAEARPVGVGDWEGDDWFITNGLKDGEQVVVDGVARVAPGVPLKATPAAAAASTPAAKS
jgi:membrane fusion protein, multidrug efflux system